MCKKYLNKLFIIIELKAMLIEDIFEIIISH